MSDSQWTTVLSALLTPVIAIFGSIIAYRQWRTAQNKLKLDLFERRQRVYDVARELISSIITSGKTSPEQEFKYLSGTRGAIWLFNQEIVDYLDKDIWTKICDLWALQQELGPELSGDERGANIHKQREIKDWLSEQLRVLEGKFAPFLTLRH